MMRTTDVDMLTQPAEHANDISTAQYSSEFKKHSVNIFMVPLPEYSRVFRKIIMHGGIIPYRM